MKEDSKTKEIRERFIANKKVCDLLKKYRKLAGIRSGGLSYEEFRRLGKDKKKWDHINKYCKEFSSEVIKFWPEGFSKEFIRQLNASLGIYFLSDIFDSFDGKFNTSDCDVIHIVNGLDDTYPKREKIKDGIYIKIGSGSSINAITQFIKDRKEVIRFLQKEIIEELELKKPSRIIRKRTKKERDELIYMMSKKTQEDLSSMGGGNSTYQDIQIQNILERDNIMVSNDNIRKIISKQRKLHL